MWGTIWNLWTGCKAGAVQVDCICCNCNFISSSDIDRLPQMYGVFVLLCISVGLWCSRSTVTCISCTSFNLLRSASTHLSCKWPAAAQSAASHQVVADHLPISRLELWVNDIRLVRFFFLQQNQPSSFMSCFGHKSSTTLSIVVKLNYTWSNNNFAFFLLFDFCQLFLATGDVISCSA